jgi:hypothetical protein
MHELANVISFKYLDQLIYGLRKPVHKILAWIPKEHEMKQWPDKKMLVVLLEAKINGISS